MNTLALEDTTIDQALAAGHEPAQLGGRTLNSRLAALLQGIGQGRADQGSYEIADAALADLNDETLIDLGFDPASVRRHTFVGADPMAKFIL